ncbi:PAS domain S-box protein [Halomicroarcula sp. GCM10025817]|uniref:PAS domain S-box protein n=1 Tax=Haloarcula TaxID=2237 RepID=UPI0023E8FB5F|nr:PAS domain S-box protein [Halomicroarcula sp. SYNS111]
MSSEADGIDVLYVDDDPDFAALAAVQVHRVADDIAVTSESDPFAALDRAETGSFDCVVSDYDMPVMNGLELFEAVQSAAIDLPFVLFTRTDDVAGEAIEAGVTEFQRKRTGSDQFAVLANRIRRAVEHRRATDALAATRRQLDRYETLVENVGDAMYVLDRSGEIQVANDAMASHLGTPKADIVGARPADFAPEADVRTGTEALRRLADDDERTWARFEMRTVDADGTVTVNENKVAPLLDEAGRVVGSVGVIRDISERKAREEELERYETIVEAVGDPVYTLDADGRFTSVNEALCQMTGYDHDELVGEHIGRIMTEADVDAGESVIRDLLEGDSDHATLEMDMVTADGERVPSENHIALLPQADGEFTGSAGVIRDIAERKERERRLAEFASVVSHDLRSPLNVVQGRIDLAQSSGDLRHLETAAEGAARMEELIEDLLTLARKGELVSETSPVDLEQATRAAWQNVDASTATLRVESTAVVEADTARLGEVFENLFRNCVEHCGDEVTVRVGTVEETDGTVTGFYVADDGPGVPEADREQVFERGYTTSDGGTGFGLAIVRDIVDAHGWTVDVRTSAAGGARFDVTTTPADR